MESTLVQKRSEILRMGPELAEFAGQCGLDHDIALSVEYFLHYWDQNAAPRLLILRDPGKSLRGAVFAYEELRFGLPTGVITGGDACGQGLLLAPPSETSAVLREAVQAFERHWRIHRIQWNCPETAWNGGAPVTPDMRSICRALPAEPYLLPLPGSFDEFLAHLGTQTRRNIRYYRRQCEKQQLTFVPSLELAEFAEAGELLRASSRYPMPQWRHRKHLELLRSLPNMRLAGIRDADGNWVSLVAGWVHGRSLSILTQLNDDGHSRLSLSLVIRSYLAEAAIAEGLRQMIFIQGSSPVFGKYAQPACPIQIWIDFDRALADLGKRAATLIAGAVQPAGLSLPALVKLTPIERSASTHPAWRTALAVHPAQGEFPGA